VRGGALAVARDKQQTEARVHAPCLAALGHVFLIADARKLLDILRLQPGEPLLHAVHLCMIRLMALPAVHRKGATLQGPTCIWLCMRLYYQMFLKP